LAELVIALVPSIEMIRFVNSGTEATMSALRLARAVTGRTKIIKMNGCYHGHADLLLSHAGSGVATLGLPDSPGVPAATAAATLTAEFNDLAGVEALFAANPGEIAAVITEPIAANMGFVMPIGEYLLGLQQLCRRLGALFVLDDVMTGFRVTPGGAQIAFGLDPDITCLGKVIGGGLPVGAFAGRRDLMEHLAPLGEVYQAGTLSGNPVATAAGLAVLAELDAGAYEQLEATATALADGLREAITSAGVAVQVPRGGTLVGLHFSDTPVHDYDEAKVGADTGRYTTFFHSMLDQGIALAPGAYEALFPSLAHTEVDIERTVDAAAAAARDVAEAAG
ncbi:MAG: hemL, partial [Actinomycetia bacterium]|nr:hemL [Actinomycetes bacterium]